MKDRMTMLFITESEKGTGTVSYSSSDVPRCDFAAGTSSFSVLGSSMLDTLEFKEIL